MKVKDAPFLQGFVRLAEEGYRKGWHERNGGNLSYRIAEEEVESVRKHFRKTDEWIPTQVHVPNLANEFFLVTGSGKYMRNVILSPEDNLAIAEVDSTGDNYRVVWGLESGGRPSSEFPSHLMNQSIKKSQSETFRVIYHAHPVNVVALTFILPLEDAAFTREIWGRMTECPVIFPEGIGVVPWMVPGGWEIALASGEKMKEFNIVVWAHHGLFCAGSDFDQAYGLMETVEKSAEISVKVRSMGTPIHEIPREGYTKLAEAFQIHLREEFLD